MPSGNDSATGIYGVSPYNYLTAQSPVDKQPPASPTPLLGNQRLSDPGQEETEEDRQPYSYLNPNAPAPFQRDGSLRPKEFTRRDPETGNVNAAVNPTYSERDMGPGSTGTAQFYPPRRESDNTSPYDSHNAREKPYIIPEDDFANYHLRDGKIPRPQVGPSGDYAAKTFSSGFDEPPPSSPKSRPVANTEYLDERYKEGERKNGRVLRVCGILLLVILCVGIGFASGWFASKYLNEQDDSNSKSSVMASSTVTTAADPVTQPITSSTMSTTHVVTSEAATTAAEVTSSTTSTTQVPVLEVTTQ